MALINPHITSTEMPKEVFNFYKSVFGGEFAKIIRFKDISSLEYPADNDSNNNAYYFAIQIASTKSVLLQCKCDNIKG